MNTSPIVLSSVPGLDRRVLTQQEALDLASRVLTLVGDHAAGVLVEHSVRAIARVINGTSVLCDGGDELTVRFASHFGSGMPVMFGTNQRSDTMLRAFAGRADATRTLRTDEDAPAYAGDPEYHTYQAREFLPVSLWRESTAAAMEGQHAETAAAIGSQLTAANMVGAATVDLSTNTTLYHYRSGLTAFARETDCEVTVTAHERNNVALGWQGQANRDWHQMRVEALTQDAIDWARRSKNAEKIEPGRYTVVLGPTAVGQLIRSLAAVQFRADLAFGGRSIFSAAPGTGKATNINTRVFDSRLSLVSDPQDPDGGFPPFLPVDDFYHRTAGLPLVKMEWIKKGVLKNLVYGASEYAVQNEKPYSGVPRSVRLINEGPVVSIEEMIANCERGIYVRRFSNVYDLNYHKAPITGMTRGGCFLIQKGKIDRPLVNFRFEVFPSMLFNNIEAIGAPQRVAFGFSPPSHFELLFASRGTSWPPKGRSLGALNAPVIAPPMMVRDFNFSALVDAV
jgi:predicted Zn-dependent protease